MDAAMKEKLEKVVTLVNKDMVDPDIDIDFCIPGVETTVKDCSESETPYILLTYVIGDYNKHTRKIHLDKTLLRETPEEINNRVTFSIEEFKGEIDSVEMG